MSHIQIQKEIIEILKENRIPVNDAILLLSQLLEGFSHVLYRGDEKSVKIETNFN